MIFIGAQVSYTLKLACPECGQSATNRFPWASLFIGMCCENRECVLGGRMVTIEKSTAIVLAIDPPMYGQMGKEKWEPMFPVLADKDGEHQWPKKS